MNERLKTLRNALGMTLEEFGRKVGVTRSAIGRIEKGDRGVTEQMCLSICREFNVNEDWLRYGTGEMFITRTRSQIITDFAADLILEEDESFKKRLIEALAQLDVDEWKVLEGIAEKLSKKS